MASIDAIVKQAQADGYLRISSSRGLAAREDAEEAYYFWCMAQGRPLVMVVDLRTRFAEVSLETLFRDPPNEQVDRKYRRRIARLFNQVSALRLTAREKKEKLPEFIRFGFIRRDYAVSCRIPKRFAARVALALLKIGTEWTRELARTSESSGDATVSVART